MLAEDLLNYLDQTSLPGNGRSSGHLPIDWGIAQSSLPKGKLSYWLEFSWFVVCVQPSLTWLLFSVLLCILVVNSKQIMQTVSRTQIVLLQQRSM